MSDELRSAALFWLACTDAKDKAAGVAALAAAYRGGQVALDAGAELNAVGTLPGVPEKPELVAPRHVKHRSMVTPEGRAILIHALVHIEFNAINLALDAIWRFSGMPEQFYVDWLQVPDEEALHFTLLSTHLEGLGYCYGDFPGHASLWEMAEKTRGDVLARMALVPRTMEARGLDVVPSLRNKLAQAGDMAAAAIMDIILRDEIGHVAIGNRWYGYLCRQGQLEPIASYALLAKQYAAPVLKAPLNLTARRSAGFSDAELDALEKMSLL